MDRLIRTFSNRETRPYHEALLTHLTLPHASDIQDRAGWIGLIQKYGVKAFPAFAAAKKIEAKNFNKAPKDIDQAKSLLAMCSYTRFNEDTDFAVICNKYQITESTFDRCLDYMKSGWPKKTGDNIPSVTIQQENFTWSKLPVDDKRALIIGQITDCCQSIGGDSEQCVKDYVSLPNNGLYILKDKNKIIGQAYVWLSKAGNLCMDSVECLTNSIFNDKLKNLLNEFAIQCWNNILTLSELTWVRAEKHQEDYIRLKHLFRNKFMKDIFTVTQNVNSLSLEVLCH
jgi:hypothetical protein